MIFSLELRMFHFYGQRVATQLYRYFNSLATDRTIAPVARLLLLHACNAPTLGSCDVESFFGLEREED